MNGRQNNIGRKADKKKGAVTMKDVAELAGVAPITVSRMLSGSARVSDEVRERIQQAVKELNYIPNRMAGGLSSASAPVVPIIVPALRNAVFADVIMGAQEALLKANLQIFIGSSNYSFEEEERLVSAFLEWSPRAIIITGQHHSDRTNDILSSVGVPVIEIMDLPEQPIDLCVGISNFKAGHDIANWLIMRGYRNIAFVGARLDVDVRARQRMEGYKSALKEAGLGNGKVIALDQTTALDTGSTVLKKLRQMDPPPDAVFCASDILAAGLIFECRRQGVNIPEDLAVAGFHNLPLAESIYPGLTTVAVPHYEIGRKAADLIIARAQKREIDSRSFDMGYHIVPRESA